MENYLSLLSKSIPLLGKGISMTLQVFLCASVISMLLGGAMGALCSNRIRVPALTPAIEVFTFVLRGVPFYVQLLIVYFVLPDIIGCNLDPFSASVAALGLCSSGYVAQLARGAINAIPESQWESAFALGYTPMRSMIHIIFPQMVRIVLPSLNNELDSLLKSTSVISTIGILELTRVGMNLVSREMEPVPIYLTIALMYLLVSASLNFLCKKLEQRLIYVKS
ncbi:MAG: amino acid ABC transporter permease [Chlamydiae bacterium]|nr:amino acid ABC transporter permease [Chlamydiota bacterium]